MHHEYLNVNDALPELAGYVLGGDEVGTRTGNRALERLHETVTLLEPWMRYPMLPQRRASLPAQIAETMWVLAGRNDVKWLSRYLPRAPEFSDDGKTWRGGYGPRIRGLHGVDQLKHVVDLLRADPLSRRAVIQIYDAEVDSQPGKDIPCNDFITFQSRLGVLNMHVFVRSNDLVWGWSGINAFEWSVLQEVVAGILGIGVGHLTFSISSLHLYDRHWKRMRELHEAYPDPAQTPWGVTFDAPRVNRSIQSVQDLDDDIALWFAAEKKIRQAASFEDAMSAVMDADVNPMFESWLEVLAVWWWDADPSFIGSATLRSSLKLSPKQKHPLTAKAAQSHPGLEDILPEDLLTEVKGWEVKPVETPERNWGDFIKELDELQKTKHESYGNSWKKRGEVLGILANIARKTDRLGKSDDYETALDTAADLLIYLIKHQSFLYDLRWDASESDSSEWVTGQLDNILQDGQHFDSQPGTAEERAGGLVWWLNRHILADDWVKNNSVKARQTEVGHAQQLAAVYLYKLWKEQNK